MLLKALHLRFPIIWKCLTSHSTQSVVYKGQPWCLTVCHFLVSCPACVRWGLGTRLVTVVHKGQSWCLTVCHCCTQGSVMMSHCVSLLTKSSPWLSASLAFSTTETHKCWEPRWLYDSREEEWTTPWLYDFPMVIWGQRWLWQQGPCWFMCCSFQTLDPKVVVILTYASQQQCKIFWWGLQ